MRTGRPKAELSLSPQQQAELSTVARSRLSPQVLIARAKLVLWSARGDSNSAIAKRLHFSRPTIAKWRQRFSERGLEALSDAPRTGRPRVYGDEAVAHLINTALQSKPAAASHWSVRSVAARTGVSKSTVARYCALFGIQPQRGKSFKLSTDPFFAEKVRAIVGLYLNPPDKALVLCVDGKSEVEALERMQPGPSMGLGYLEGITHGYYRHGITTLFAALNILDRLVIGPRQRRRDRHEEFVAFLNHLDRHIPEDLEIHLVADNYATHKHPRVKAWLARRPRYHLHYAPNYAGWLIQVERWLAVERWFILLTHQAIPHGYFPTVRELLQRIDDFVSQPNTRKPPFAWTATTDPSINKLRALCKVSNGTSSDKLNLTTC